MSGTVAFTSFTYAYLPQALVLAETFRAAHPDWELHALVVEEPHPAPALAAALTAAFDRVVFASDLGIPRFRPWLFKHDVVEACTAVKATMLRRLLGSGYARVAYFDPDIAIFHKLDDVLDRLDEASIILTPHQVTPNDTEWAVRDNELTSMRYGIYNLGFIAVAPQPDGLAFAQWWEQRLFAGCFDDVANGIFTDQKYCDLVPGLFDRVFVDRDPGCNVASWNLSRRDIVISPDGRILVNGSPLKFYHFTKARSVGGMMTEKYARENREAFEIWRWYGDRLNDFERRFELPAWSYDSFSNGAPIRKSARVLFRERGDLSDAFSDPFDAHGNSYYAWLADREPTLLAA